MPARFNVFPLHLRREEIAPALRELGVAEDALPDLLPRFEAPCLHVEGLDCESASVLCEIARSVGGGLAAASGFGAGSRPGLLVGTHSQLRDLARALQKMPLGLAVLAEELDDCLKRMEAPRKLLIRGRDCLADRTFLLVGIVNVTPDSFSDGGRFLDPERAVAHGVALAEEGADILDVGAESSRPGSDPVPENEELRRLVPVLEGLRRALPDIVLSVDTTKASVAAAALGAGADMVNDISGGLHDPGLIPLCARQGAPVVLMHMRGEPKTMQESPSYGDVLAEVVKELRERVAATEDAGLGAGHILVDPGFGFSKLAEHNLRLIAHLEALTCLGHPILVGASRKSTIGALTGAPVEERLSGTLALHTVAFLRGASILRVHDVKEHRQALTCAAATLGSREP